MCSQFWIYHHLGTLFSQNNFFLGFAWFTHLSSLYSNALMCMKFPKISLKCRSLDSFLSAHLYPISLGLIWPQEPMFSAFCSMWPKGHTKKHCSRHTHLHSNQLTKQSKPKNNFGNPNQCFLIIRFSRARIWVSADFFFFLSLLVILMNHCLNYNHTILFAFLWTLPSLRALFVLFPWPGFNSFLHSSLSLLQRWSPL